MPRPTGSTCNMQGAMHRRLGRHLAVHIGWEVVGQQVVVAACGDGLHQGLKDVCPAKGAVPYQIDGIDKARVQLQAARPGQKGA